MRRNRVGWAVVLVYLAMILASAIGVSAQDAHHVNVLEIEGPVTPIMISYIERGLATAESDGAEVLIIKLNTPGGQIDLMNEIVQLLLGADVPTAVYVSPAGAYAASAPYDVPLGSDIDLFLRKTPRELPRRLLRTPWDTLPDRAVLEKAEKLVDQLGSEDKTLRKQAKDGLDKLGSIVHPYLDQFVDSDNTNQAKGVEELLKGTAWEVVYQPG